MRKVLEYLPVKILHRVLGDDAELHLVGGCVRDSILNVDAQDVDIATKLTPEQVIERLDYAGIPSIPTGIRRGTITALVEDGSLGIGRVPIEITTFRNPEKETQYTDSILKDLPARDFTINAIAISVNTGELIDPHGGQEDLKNKILKAVGDPFKRFEEDPHRILRMIRFGCAKEPGWKIDMNTGFAAGNKAHLMKNLSIERVRDEFIKILCLVSLDTYFFTFHCLNVTNAWDIICPEFKETIGMEQNKHHKLTVDEHIAQVICNVQPDPIIRLAAFFHDIAKPRCLTIDEDGSRHFLRHEDVGAEIVQTAGERLKLPSADIAKIKHLVAEHMRPIDVGPKGARRLIKEMGDDLHLWLDLKHADKVSGHNLPDSFEDDWLKFVCLLHEEKDKKDRPSFDKLAIDGHDIMFAFEVKPGKHIGQVLKVLEEIVVDDPEKNTVPILMEEAKTFLFPMLEQIKDY